MERDTPEQAFRQAAEVPLLEKVIEGIVGKVIDNAGSRTVFGEPIRQGDRTIIPVSRVSYRFGFGAGSGPSAENSGPAPGGGGGGGMLDARPVGFIETTAEGSWFEPVIDWSRILQTMFTCTGVGIVLLLWGIGRSSGKNG